MAGEEQPDMAEENKTTRPGDAIRDEQLKLVFAQAPLAIIISPMVATTLAIGLWQVVDHGSVMIWVGIIRGLLGAYRWSDQVALAG